MDKSQSKTSSAVWQSGMLFDHVWGKADKYVLYIVYRLDYLI